MLPSLIQSSDGSSNSAAADIDGWSLVSYAVMQFILAPVICGLSDRFGRRPVLTTITFHRFDDNSGLYLPRVPFILAAGLSTISLVIYSFTAKKVDYAAISAEQLIAPSTAGIVAMKMFSVMLILFILSACTATEIDTQPAFLGQPANLQIIAETIERAGPIEFKKTTVANWQVPLSGLLNLNHPKAAAAGLTDHAETIQIYLYVLKHPKFGTFLVDSGIWGGFTADAGKSKISYVVRTAMNTAKLELLKSTASVLESLDQINGVFLTHLHLDHVIGLPDIPRGVPIYIGPDEASSRMLMHAATRGSISRLLAKVNVLNEWQFDEEGVIDVFGDGSLWAIHTPGHTPGSTAFLARTTNGAELIIGDTTHTRWGWDNQVEAGSYSKDQELNAESLKTLTNLVLRHPQIKAHPGHQH